MLPKSRIAPAAATVVLALSLGLAPARAEDDAVTVRRVITTSQTKVQKTPETNSGSTSTTSTVTRGVGFKNANKVEFKYKERIKNFEEQLVMGKQKGWLTDQEILEFREKLDVLIDLEKTVSGKDYPKADLDKMEKMFTLYNEQFHKAATTPMAKKSVQKKPTKSSKPTSKTTK
ncbi:MAG: hypothetical protein H6677_15265 [Candidatus Obscuribacterales bacterium]|nr:hypothetical protein [Cyanobacteria bacterium HKST-UBA01]MCB9469625.1 hypothetical protein [Candidatus Obscuribacterales bacterium]